MNQVRKTRFESLENRRLLAVSASVTAGGDLVVQGDAEGAVQIVAVSPGAYQVTDNGNVVADVTGVTDDIRIALDKTAGAGNQVTVDLTNLGADAVDEVIASLGNGANTFTLMGGSANSLTYKGGRGTDDVTLDTPITESAGVGLGGGDNSLTVNAELGRLSVKSGSGADVITLAATAPVANGVDAHLGEGDNSFSAAASIGGNLKIQTGDGDDTIELPDGTTIGKSVKLQLGGGDNTTTIGGDIGGSLKYNGRDGNDSIAIAATAAITDNFFARLGAGDNTATLDGTVGGNLHIVSANANDQVAIADPALVSGATTLGLGEQTEEGEGHCGHGGEHHHGRGGEEAGESEGLRGRTLGLAAAGGRTGGFFFRGPRR